MNGDFFTMARDYVIVTDSCADMDENYYNMNGIKVIGLHYTIGIKSYTQGSSDDLTVEKFYDRVRSGVLPKSSPVTYEDALEIMESIASDGKDIFFLCFSSELSTTYQTCQIAAQDVMAKYSDCTIKVIDSISAALGQGLLLHLCVKKKNAGTITGIVNNCKNFGYMPQTFSLFADLSVYDNLDYFSILYNVPKNRINEVLKDCFLDDKRDLLCSQLSGGYKQLTALAVAILHAPPFLILDEPTSAMDPIFRDKFWQIIEKYAKEGNSILIITHYMEEIQKCKKLMALSNGKIIYNNSVEETFAKGDIKSVAEVLYKFSEVSYE